MKSANSVDGPMPAIPAGRMPAGSLYDRFAGMLTPHKHAVLFTGFGGGRGVELNDDYMPALR